MKETIMRVEKKPITIKGYCRPAIDNSIGSHENDPFILKKVEDAKKAISKLKLPVSSEDVK